MPEALLGSVAQPPPCVCVSCVCGSAVPPYLSRQRTLAQATRGGALTLPCGPFHPFLISPATDLGAFQGPKCIERHLLLTRTQQPHCGSEWTRPIRALGGSETPKAGALGPPSLQECVSHRINKLTDGLTKMPQSE